MYPFGPLEKRRSTGPSALAYTRQLAPSRHSFGAFRHVRRSTEVPTRRATTQAAPRRSLGLQQKPTKVVAKCQSPAGQSKPDSLYGGVLMPVLLGETRLISVEEAAKYLGVQKSTIYSWAWRRKIPSVKMGRRLLFDQEDLDRMIEAGKRRER